MGITTKISPDLQDAVRQKRIWRVAHGLEAASDSPFGIMAILNITPDSFFDGGSATDEDAILGKAQKLLEKGANIIDVGAESTRPGALPITPEEERHRLFPILSRLIGQYPQTLFSVDTRNSRTAAMALEAGAAIINDVSACRRDAELMEILASFKPGYVLMHSQGDPETMQRSPRYGDAVSEIKNFFEFELNRFIKAGLPEENILLDPGIGFGKNLSHNLEILTRFNEFLVFGRPLLAAVSMKSLFGSLLNLPIGDRSCATSALSALLWEKGAFWHRIHDVKNVKNALIIANAVSNSQTKGNM